jgi:subtilisin family serine protease
VAGIIAGRCDAKKFRGVAPDCKLVDIQVFGPKHNSMSLVVQAMARIREINAQAGQMVIHGANLSIGSSNEQNVTDFMPGQSPECKEANRLVQSGVVVCVAAGDYGAKIFLTQGKGGTENYASFIDMAIADPGNAELPITVGSTHKDDPSRYGISPFSAKGPTGDGRFKPDLVAPGEKILSTFPGDQYQPLSGTSQSTPVVSGAAALLMAACPSLKGRPVLVKEILIQACQDLGRARHFQGAGLLDIRRAIAIGRAQYY